MDLVLDEGYMFGIGLFETIAVEENHCILLEEHIERLNKSLKTLGITKEIAQDIVLKYMIKNPIKNGVLKLMVSKENCIITQRENTYTPAQYESGFVLGLSTIIRNETSPLTYMKTFNYGDNILEKRYSQSKGWDEPIFLNTKSQICEGATTNLFFVKGDHIYTPQVSCGMLDGILRSYIVKNYEVIQDIIYPDEIQKFDEMFVTNSLLGIMPVKCFEEIVFTKREVTNKIMSEYQAKKIII